MFNRSIFSERIIIVLAIMIFASCHTSKQAVSSTHYQPSRKYKQASGSRANASSGIAGNSNSGNRAYTKPINKSSNSAYNEDVKTYIKLYSPYAVQEMKKYGVPASIIIAQGIHESSAGKSVLATVANNHFGIKCTGDWSGDSFHMDDDSPNECFRKYNNPESSFNDHMLFLQRKRYTALFNLDKSDYKGWAYGLKRCGYATNPRYAEILISMIERYQLDRFDMGSFDAGDESLASNGSGSNVVARAGNYSKKSKSVLNLPIQKASGDVPPPSSTDVRDGKSASAIVTKSPDHKTFIISDTVHQKVYVADTIYQYAYQKAISKARANKSLTGSGSSSGFGSSSSASSRNAADKENDSSDNSAIVSPDNSVINSSGNSVRNSSDNSTINFSDDSVINYKVKQGDTLYGICRRLKINIEEVKKLNNLPDYGIKLDQVLKIPK